jgi:hypothetical protein
MPQSILRAPAIFTQSVTAYLHANKFTPAYSDRIVIFQLVIFVTYSVAFVTSSGTYVTCVQARIVNRWPSSPPADLRVLLMTDIYKAVTVLTDVQTKKQTSYLIATCLFEALLEENECVTFLS